MTRNAFGGTSDDQVVRKVGTFLAPVAGVTVTFWSTQTGGTQYTDLQDSSLAPITAVTSDADGYLPRFFGPDGVTSMWVESGGGTRRLMYTQGMQGPAGTPGAGGGTDTSVAAFLNDPASATRAALTRSGKKPVGQDELLINVKDYGAKGDGTTDDTTAIQNALNAVTALGSRTVLFPGGKYLVSSTLTIPAISGTSNGSGRSGGITLAGHNMYASVIVSTVAGYTFTGAAESLHVQDLCVKTSTAGGFNLTQGGALSFQRFFMDGCGAGYWGITASVPYPVTIDGCRFWNNGTAYQGGAWNISGAIAVNLRANFVSRQQKNGDITVLNNCYNINHQSGMYESLALGGSAFTSQVMISLQGVNQGGYIDGVYTECQANKIIDIVAGQSARGIRIGSIYAFQRDDSTLGDPNFMAINAPNALSTPLAVDSITFVSQPAATGGYIVNDPTNSVEVRAFRNTSTGNQLTRLLTQRADTAATVRAFNSAGQSISTSVTTALSFDSESFDSHGFHDTATNATRFTVPSGKEGTYLCVAQVALNGTGGNRRALVVRKNSSAISGTEMPPPTSSSTAFRLQVHELVSLAAGDFIEFTVFQDSGAGLTAISGEFSTWGSVTKIR